MGQLKTAVLPGNPAVADEPARTCYVKYDVTGKVTGMYTDPTFNTPMVTYSYDESGQRISRTDNTGTSYYVYDASGNSIAIYNGTTLAEVPFYGSNRLGIFTLASNNYQYELRDNVGSVRVVVNRDRNGQCQPDVTNYFDYYPFGSVAQSGGTGYRYQYQGAYAEQDQAMLFDNFKLRLYDGKIGRWLTTDPAGQYASPYVGMGNNPVMGSDPTGGDTGDGASDDGFQACQDWVEIQGTFIWDDNVHNDADAHTIYGADAKDVTPNGTTYNYTASNGRLAYVGAGGPNDFGYSYLEMAQPKSDFQSTVDWDNEFKAGIDQKGLAMAEGAIGLATVAIPGGEAGAIDGGNAEEVQAGIQFTKSSLKLGREMHTAYMAAEEAMGIGVKEFRGIPGIRPDFVNFTTRTIYELKPFNPASIERGVAQLLKYQSAFQKAFPGEAWNVVLHTY